MSLLQSLSERMPTVLVADRTDLLRRNLTSRLQAEGYDVLQAANGPEAVAYLVKERPDAAVLEAELPGISGEELCRLAKDRLNLPHAHMVVLAGHEDLARTRSALDAGAADVLVKPLSLDDLVSRLNEALAPRPVPGQVLTLRAIGTNHLCLVSAWQGKEGGKLVLDHGPELLWLGGDPLKGVPLSIGYPGPHGIRLSREATMRLATRRDGQRHIELTLSKDLPRRSPAPERALTLGVKYAAQDGSYQPALLLNASASGIRLGGVLDALEPNTPLSLFLFHQQDLRLALKGTVQAQRPDGQHYETALALTELAEATRRALIDLFKPGSLTPPQR